MILFRLIPLAVLQSIFLCGGQVLLKLAMLKSGAFSWTWSFFKAQLTNWWFPACGISFGAATVLWLYLLKHFPFSIVYPLSCMSYALGIVAAVFVFREEVNWVQWLGVLFIMAGCALIVKY